MKMTHVGSHKLKYHLFASIKVQHTIETLTLL